MLLKSQPVLRYSIKTSFCNKGWFYLRGGFLNDSLPSVLVGPSGANKTWDFTGFKARAAVELVSYNSPFDCPSKYQHRDFTIEGMGFQEYEQYRLSNHFLSIRGYHEDGTARLLPFMPIPFRYKKVHHVDGEGFSTAGKDTNRTYESYRIEGYAWGKLLTPLNTYNQTLLVKRTTIRIDSPAHPSPVNRGAYRSREVNYRWYAPNSGQCLFRVDSFYSDYDRGQYARQQSVYIGYYSDQLDSSGIVVIRANSDKN